jgi:hypothetical protein
MNPHRYPPMTDPNFPYESVVMFKCAECHQWCDDGRPTPCLVHWHPQYPESETA